VLTELGFPGKPSFAHAYALRGRYFRYLFPLEMEAERLPGTSRAMTRAAGVAIGDLLTYNGSPRQLVFMERDR